MTKPLLALLLAPGLALAQTPFTYHISGKIGELNAPYKVYLTGGEKLDSATLTNGVFELKGTADMPKRGGLSVQRDGWHDKAAYANATSIFLEPTPVVVISDGNLRSSDGALQNPSTTITGGPLSAELEQLYASVPPKATPEQYAQAYTAFIKTHPNSWVSLMALWDMGAFVKRNYEEVGPLYAALSPELKASKQGRTYGELVQGLKATAIGELAPNFTQKTPAGKSVSLADYRGKYVLLVFWYSCDKCRDENPNLVKAYQAFKGPRFDMLGVSLDQPESRKRWKKAIAADQLAWAQVLNRRGEPNDAWKLYGYTGTPPNYLIDPSGKIIATNLKGAELQATLARYLK